MGAHWIALALLTTARVSIGFQFQSVASVSPTLVQQLGLTYAELGTIIGLYFLPGVGLALPAGMLGRRFGDKQMVIAALTLMAIGGTMTGAAGGFASLATGRIVSGTGAVILNVLMSKMVTDWFAGRPEIVLAMAIFVNSFPIGIGLAMLTLGPLGDAAGWHASLAATAGLAGAAMLLVGRGYHPHPNNGPSPASETVRVRISRREVGLVCLAGAIWGLFNGAVSIVFGFTPGLLIATGISSAGAGLVLGITSWLLVGSIQAGGMASQKWGRPAAWMALGIMGWCSGLLAMVFGHPVLGLFVGGVLMGLPVGIMMSLPAQVLRPETRAVGMGLCYVCLYVGQAGLPPVAGWLQDSMESASAAFWFAAAAVLAILPLYAVFRISLRRESVPAPSSSAVPTLPRG